MRNGRAGRLARSALPLALVTVLTVGAIGAPSATARTLRARLLDMVNHSRVAHGLRPLRINLRLSDDAAAHSDRMVRQDRLLEVENLADVLRPYRYRWGGASVSCASTLRRAHRVMMEHLAHRRILLSRYARRIGIGITVSHGKTSCGDDAAYWVTEILYG